ncbi:succinate dehydrogenase, hydrophobic membrane anchor protein [Nitrosospira lacus]|uniref:Succinate dehydrogenase hydrophobic membrane anchor subunit n=1 Tax=Nitrosospira lacus TaxID=1288494 RepID=A0A1W6SNQ7_9PROT|nr:succinate dehydrogenase, hydrophobic membrane anchor protein [Nitrosospira lacus]ARO87433.1 succinate dehydrogenase, hydrophobic membrane anchor protein [Nitrosospira lacus]
MVKRIVTGAHYGLRDWLAQRVTAVVMVVFVLCLAIALLISPPHDYAMWKSLLSGRWMRIASFLFLVSLFWHAWVGMRNILMDYVHATGMRLTLQILVILSLLFYTVWSAEILWALELAWR